uniref:RBR-type E3 ubiquitin transferase n=1 Tax=Arcella intermedia TaxID=1963864 RepID=A0A6B2L1M1_9EUKA
MEMENKEMDAIWEQHLNEEEMEKKLELAITGSKALTSSGIHNLRSKMINKVSEILQIKTHVAQAILNKANWDHEKVLFEYFNDPEAYLKGLNLDENTIRDPENGDNGTGDKKEEEEKTITCSICFDDFPLSKTTKLDTCGHLFCNDCWGDNLNFQISTGHTIDINCMSQNCNELVPPHVVQKLVSPEMCSKYNTFLGKTFVENSKTIIWCTAPGCDLALSDPVTEGKIRVLTCECGLRICWACRKEAHPPLTCEEVANFMSEAEKNPELKYLVDNDLDAETLKWMHENTKECPFCNVTIQKNDGCFCMTCSSCHKQWCWLCKESWSTHSGHFRCSKYGVGENGLKNTAEHNDKDLLKKRLELEKLLTVFKAYKSNSDGGGVLIDENDKKRMESILKEWESFDISFIPEAKKTIKKCKESLKYTQMFLFVHKGKNRAIGEYLYEILQTAVGRLSQSLDKDPLLIKAPEVRKCTNLCLLALENLLAFVTEDTELTVNTKKKKPKTEKIKST